MKNLVESLKRLYPNNKDIVLKTINRYLSENHITQQDYDYITQED